MVRLFSIVFLLVLPSLGHATCEGPNLIEALSADERALMERRIGETPFSEGLYWRGEKDGATVHVLGTLHIPDPRHAAIVAEIAGDVAAADLVILEITVGTELRMQSLMMERPEIALITEGPTLIDLLGDDWPAVADQLRARGIPPFMAAKFQPRLLMMLLSLPPCAMEDLTLGLEGLDRLVEERAVDAGVPLAELDEIDGLIGLLSGGSLEEQVDMLRLSLITPFDAEAMHATMYDSYFAGRHREIWELNRLLSESWEEEAFDGLETRLLEDRNGLWAGKLPGLLADKDAVIAVGAAHLSGETGVLSTLDDLGYALTRVPLTVERTGQ